MLRSAVLLAQEFDEFGEFQDPDAGFAAAFGILVVVYLAVIVLLIAATWRIFTKAGEPGWAALIPIYSTLVLLRVVGRPWWWILLFLIPLVNLIFLIILDIDLARAFGKRGGFAVGLIFLPFIFYPILGFGSAEYQRAEVGSRPG